MTNIFVDTEGNRFEGTDFFDHETQQWLVALKPLADEPKPNWELIDREAATGRDLITIQLKDYQFGDRKRIADALRAVLIRMHAPLTKVGRDYEVNYGDLVLDVSKTFEERHYHV